MRCACREEERCVEGAQLWEQVEACYRALHAVLLVGGYEVRERAWRAYQEALCAYERHVQEERYGVGEV